LREAERLPTKRKIGKLNIEGGKATPHRGRENGSTSMGGRAS